MLLLTFCPWQAKVETTLIAIAAAGITNTKNPDPETHPVEPKFDDDPSENIAKKTTSSGEAAKL
jgi:hypothetical protein